jgi:hypothetical protein
MCPRHRWLRVGEHVGWAFIVTRISPPPWIHCSPIATEAIPRGALLIRERAYAHTLKRGILSSRVCHECLHVLHEDDVRLSCAVCTDAHVVYCSDECRVHAAHTFHRYQCMQSWWTDGYGRGDTHFAKVVSVLSRTPIRLLVECRGVPSNVHVNNSLALRKQDSFMMDKSKRPQRRTLIRCNQIFARYSHYRARRSTPINYLSA